jgi:hypothetical protein
MGIPHTYQTANGQNDEKLTCTEHCFLPHQNRKASIESTGDNPSPTKGHFSWNGKNPAVGLKKPGMTNVTLAIFGFFRLSCGGSAGFSLSTPAGGNDLYSSFA